MNSKHYKLCVLLTGAMLLMVCCDRSPSRFTKEISRLCPNGWQVSASNNVITLRREAVVWAMPYIARPAVAPWESKADFFRNHGGKTQYEVRLEIVPVLSRPEYERLKANREQAAVRFNKGASGKVEYDRLIQEYEKCRVPAFFTKDYSIFVDRESDPRFVEVYPPEAAAEIESVIKSLATLFEEYGK